MLYLHLWSWKRLVESCLLRQTLSGHRNNKGRKQRQPNATRTFPVPKTQTPEAVGRQGLELVGPFSRKYMYTPPETNIAPETRVSQKETIIPTIHFQGLC